MRKFIIFLALISSAWASKTTLTGTLTDSQGQPLNGVLTMKLPVPAQDTTTNTAVSNIPVTFNVVNGSIVGGAPLYDVANLQPQGLYYIARARDTSGNLQFYGNYVVTGVSFNLGTATPTQVTTSNISYILPIFPNQTNTFTAAQTFTTILSASSPDAGTGFIRQAQNDLDCWRNAANSADVCVGYSSVGGLDYIATTGSGGILANSGVFAGPQGTNVQLVAQTVNNGASTNILLLAGTTNGFAQPGGSISLQPSAGTNGQPNGKVQISHGIGGNGTGFQHKRVASCTTGAGAGSTCNTTITWSNTFDDTNYTVACTVSGGTGAVTGTPYILNTSSKTTTTTVVTIVNLTAVASSGTLDCMAAHD